MVNNLPPFSLWHLIISPLAWALHFLGIYIFVAIYCAKFNKDNSPVPILIGMSLITLIALLIVIRECFAGYKRHQAGVSSHPFNLANPEDRNRFLGRARALISGLSAIAILYTAYAVFFIRSCQ